MSFYDADTKSYIGFEAALAEDLAAALGVKLQFVRYIVADVDGGYASGEI